MSPGRRRELPANLGADAFVGTAEAYARYRPPYPRALLADLVDRVGSRRRVFLDLATGPGRIALDLAGLFERVVAVDLEPEMIAIARAVAERRGIANVEWRVGRAEDLDAASGTVDLVTIGEAFHRLDGRLIAREALTWLRPGGCLATLGPNGMFADDDPWQVSITEIRERWMVRAFPGGRGNALVGGSEVPGNREQVFLDAGFVDVAEHAFVEPRTWTFDQIVGYLQSTSVCSMRAIGDDFPAFEADLRAALRQHSPSLTFEQTVSWSYTLARKPLTERVLEA